MDKPKILSGEAIAAKAATKVNVSLPEAGLKHITSNGSWLEQKQIQAALEARKNLIEVERIEKLGTLSLATWQDDLKLAEVTQKTGSHWQYLGHNVGQTLYLKPEEALFLIEVNCLLLKHNDVTVSLQKAYSLLLNETISITQYRVYASLSRLGYKVFRHKVPKVNKKIPKIESENKSETLNVPLKIDTTSVEVIVDQPLTDSSVEVVDIKNNDFLTNNKSVDEHLPTIEQNNSADEGTLSEANNVECSVDDDDDSNKLSNTVKVRSECTSAKETDEKKIDNTSENNSREINESFYNIEKQISPSSTKANVVEHTQTVQMIETNNETLNAECVNTAIELNKTETVMNVDEPDENISTINTLSTITDSNMSVGGNGNEMLNDTNTTKIKSTHEDNNVENVNNRNENKFDDMTNSTDCQEAPDSSMETTEGGNESINIHSAVAIEVDTADSDVVMDLDTPNGQDFATDKTVHSLSDVIISKRNQIFHNYVTKLKKLTSRLYKPSDFKSVEKHFQNIPDFFKKEIIAINVPEQQYIPKNIFVNNSSYVLNMTQIKRRSLRSVSIDSSAYNSSDEVNDNHVRRIRSTSATDFSQNLQFVNNIRFPPRQTLFFRPCTFLRSQNHLDYVQFNMFFQRPCFPNLYFHSRFQYQQRPNPLIRPFSFPNNLNLNPNNTNNIFNNNRKRLRSARAMHLQSIKNLAVRLKQLIIVGNTHFQNIESLHRLLFAYNTRYKARLRLTKHFEVVSDENIVETINLEEDEESASKRRRLSQDGDKFDENLDLLKQLALRLQDLDAKEKITPKHKRAMSKAIKTFNKSYDADIYMTNNYEVINKRLINIESDSESDCVVSEPKKIHKKKKLRNPFNILKRLSEKQAGDNPSTSKICRIEEFVNNHIEPTVDTKYNDSISKNFNENWLPSENDFGRAEVVHKNSMNCHFVDTAKEEYLFNFMKNHFDEFNNWLEAKIAFLQHMEETEIAFQNENDQVLAARESVSDCGLKPLIDAEDRADMPSVLERLRIIKNNKETNTESSLSIHFDVYNRDVHNFKKTNPPKPHFRVICMEQELVAELNRVLNRISKWGYQNMVEFNAK